MKKNNWLFILFLAAFTFFLLCFFQIDPDYLWHVKAGEYMVQHGLLTKDVFSWSVFSQYWMSHEWLFEIIIYGLKCIFGKYHLFVYCFLCLFSLLFILYYGNKDKIYDNFIFSIVWFICSFILSFIVQGRPHLISNCFLALTFYFLYDLYKNKDSKKIYFLPFISVIWANIHGGSSNFPYLLCLLFIIAGSFQFRFHKIEAFRISKKQCYKYFVVMLLCMVAVCINLHGFKMFIYPYQNMIDHTMLQNIAEWRSTSLNELSHYVYFALLIFIVFVFIFSKKKIEFVDFIVFGFCTYLGLKSIRFWFYTYIMMSFIVFYYIPKRKVDRGSNLGLVGLSGILFFLFCVRCNAIFSISYKYLLDKKDIQTIREENPKRLYNMYDLGGDLIYNEIPVFIDGRADLYGKYNYSDYLNISTLQGDYVKLIEKYDFDYFLVQKKYPIATYLKYDSTYDLVYHNKNVLLYKKRTMSP